LSSKSPVFAAYFFVSMNVNPLLKRLSSHPLGLGGDTPAGAKVDGERVRLDIVSKGNIPALGRPPAREAIVGSNMYLANAEVRDEEEGKAGKISEPLTKRGGWSVRRTLQGRVSTLLGELGEVMGEIQGLGKVWGMSIHDDLERRKGREKRRWSLAATRTLSRFRPRASFPRSFLAHCRVSV
jgi:hypothetical protein